MTSNKEKNTTTFVKVGKILALYYASDKQTLNVKALSLDEKGVLHDKHYDKDLQRSVLIASQDSYTLASNHDIKMPNCALGENILMDYNPYHLVPGSKIMIGELLLEISQNCTLCKGLANVNPKLPKLLKKDRGIFAKVLSSGTIYLNDSIYIEKSLTNQRST